MNDSITTTSGTISVRHGTEGATHDPYAFTDYLWEPIRGQRIQLRLGIVVVLKTLADSPITANSAHEEEHLQHFFWNQVGMTEKTFDKALQRLDRGPYAPEDPYGYYK